MEPQVKPAENVWAYIADIGYGFASMEPQVKPAENLLVGMVAVVEVVLQWSRK